EQSATLSAVFQRSAEIAAADAQAAGDDRRAVQLWRRLTAHEPNSGYYALGLIRALAHAGDRTGALQFARVYESLVEERSGSADPAVLAAVTALRRGEHLSGSSSAGNLRPISSVEPRVAAPGTGADVAAGEAAAASAGSGDGHVRSPTPAASPSAAPAPDRRDAHSVTPPAPDARTRRRRRALVIGAALIGPIGVVALFASAQMRQSAGEQSHDSNRIVVLPCETDENVASTDVRDCDALIRHALQRWTDLDIVDPLVLDARLQRTSTITHDARMQVAAELGAEYAVVAQVKEIPGGALVQASLHDVRSRRSLRTRAVQVTESLPDATRQMHGLMASLLSYNAAESSGPSPLGTTRLAAWRAMHAGRVAVGKWDLAAAHESFSDAVSEDSLYAQATYWLAEVEHWRREVPREVWRAMAARAVALSDGLPEREQRQARALAHLAERSYPEACEEYDALISEDSVNVVAWLGRAECHAEDMGILPNSLSRTGWSFRASRSAAMQSYTRALSLAPTAFRMFAMPRFTRLSSIYPTNANAAIAGYAVGDPSRQFIAFPELQGDSIAFIPIPLVAGGIQDADMMPQSKAVAAQRAARQLRDLTSLWVAADENDPAAHEAHAFALEENGEVIATLSGRDALWHARRAFGLLSERGVEPTSAEMLRLGVTEVRLLVKRGAFAEAHDRGDGLLALSPDVDGAGARQLLPIAALLGRIAELEDLERRASPSSLVRRPDLMDIPGVRRAAGEQSLLLTAITGGLAASDIEQRYTQLVRTIENAVPAENREVVMNTLMLEVGHLGLPYLPEGAEERMGQQPALPMMQAQMVLRSGAIEEAARIVSEKVADMRQQGGSAWPSDWLLAARLALATGDSTVAVEMLDRGLASLPRAASNILSMPHVAAAIPEMAAMRARLGAVEGAGQDAERWETAAIALRRTADPPLRGGAVR
ncbi:MAG TPA: hypothetical protein VKZ41_09925, partial [Gemmatimonadales bacterium]|nr:hypothetical protein [Gemmatimonadales bacterium]